MEAPDPQESLAAYLRVQRAADRDILRALRDAYKDVNADLGRLARDRSPSAEARRLRLRATKQAILQAQGEMFRRTGQIIEQRRVEAAARAIRVAGRYDEAAFALLGRGPDARALSESLEETETRSVEALIARMNGSSVPLSARVYRAEAWTSGRLERRINSALARGLSAEDMARELRDFINPRTPGGVRYAALRLARTEINNAYHAMAIRAAELKPWVEKVKWNLSKSHPTKDKCDDLSGKLFKPEDTPRKPHPQCMCYITPEIGGSPREDEAFLDALAGGEFDDFLDDVIARHNL